MDQIDIALGVKGMWKIIKTKVLAFKTNYETFYAWKFVFCNVKIAKIQIYYMILMNDTRIE